MPIFKILLILAVMVPAAFVMLRTAADLRRDIRRSRQQARAQAGGDKSRLRVIR